MPRKYIANYKKLAAKRGNMDPLQYLWEQYEEHRKAGKHTQATNLAELLMPYGHGKQAPRDKEGDTVQAGVFQLD